MAQAPYETILFEKRGPVGLITLNRPDRMNAWLRQMNDEMTQAIETSNDDPDIAAIVVTGAGKGFCAGADMEATFKKQMDGKGDANGGSNARGLDWVSVVRGAKPLIAAVNGAAVGVGLTMIVPFDVIVASEKAKFGCFFVKMGLVPELASSHFLVSRMGFGRASEMMLSGRLYSAQEAYDKGLADYLYPEDRFLEEALKIGESFAGNPAGSMRMIKQLITENAAEQDLGSVERRELTLLNQCYETPEHHEAVNAFLEKRPPDFRKARA